MMEKIKTKSCCFEKLNKTEKYLTKLIKKKGNRKTQTRSTMKKRMLP